MAPGAGSYSCPVTVLLGAFLLVAVVAAWTAWETTMAGRLRADRRPLVLRTAARNGAEKLTALGQLGLVALVVAVTALTGVGWSNGAAAVQPLTARVLTSLLLLGALVAVGVAARGRLHRRRSWALAAVVLAAVMTELLLRGFALGAMADLPVTVSVLLAALGTGALQAWRSPWSRLEAAAWATVLGFVLGLVATVTGSVLAAVAIHVAVSAVTYLQSLPRRDETGGGCACGHDHSADTMAAAVAPAPVEGTSSAPSSATGAAGASTVTSAEGHEHTAGCGTGCSHSGSAACAACPLSTARV